MMTELTGEGQSGLFSSDRWEDGVREREEKNRREGGGIGNF